jgi:hypothetical protein
VEPLTTGFLLVGMNYTNLLLVYAQYQANFLLFETRILPTIPCIFEWYEINLKNSLKTDMFQLFVNAKIHTFKLMQSAIKPVICNSYN